MTKILYILVCAGMVWLGAPVKAADGWQDQRGSNFIIYYRDVPEDFWQTVMDEAEEEYRRISENIGIGAYRSWSWEKRASIYIYKDMDDYVKNGGQAGWSHGTALVTTKIIKTYPAAAGFFDSILPHELGHIIFHEYVGPTADIPLWFDEGVAMYQEKAKRVGAHATVRKAIEKGQFIPLTRLADMRLYVNSDQATVDLFYAESASAVNFLITQFGAEHFHQFCKELSKNTRFEDALVKIYMNIKGLDDLNGRWKKFLEEQ